MEVFSLQFFKLSCLELIQKVIQSPILVNTPQTILILSLSTNATVVVQMMKAIESYIEYFSSSSAWSYSYPKRKKKNNIDTYRYFGDPVLYIHLKKALTMDFLPHLELNVSKQLFDDYIYTSDDQIIEGEVEEGKDPYRARI